MRYECRAQRDGQRAAVSPTRGRLLLVDTDADVATILMDDAAAIGIQSTWCDDGAEALLTIGVEQPDVLVLAAQTNVVDAERITAAVRSRWALPILIGAPSVDEVTCTVLAAGASALISRPYDINAIAPFVLSRRPPLRRNGSVYAAGPIEVNRDGYETRVRGRDVQLTQRELELLVFLIERRGKVASSDEISRAVWGHPADTNTVAVHVRRLREKLGHDPEHGEIIRTIRGAGYRLAPSICA
ncbi:response regulator transcription factor [Mycobacterium sp. B14F4]|uniref:winged helix-turn-helix transcriptional regulator n=1 Tax=Mycobacterium sp. B14F4 TaxID=3153565 RepID=UPI00325CA4A1